MDLEKCFSILGGNKGWLFRGPDVAARLDALKKICEIRDWRVIWRLVPFLKDKNREIQLATSNAISTLLETRTSKNVFYDSLKYCDISVSDLDLYRSSFDGDQYLNLLLIASSNLSGYVREKAVQELGRSHNDKAIPFILYRLGDWVPQVRAAALSAIEKFKSAGHIDGLVENFPIIDSLRRIGRVDLSSTYASLVNHVVEANGSKVRENFRSYPEKARTLLAKHLSNTTFISDGDLQLFLRDRKPIIRALAIEHLEKLSDDEIKKLLTDKSSKVRLQILRKLQTRDDFVDVVRLYLADNSASIREFARYYLRGEMIDFAAYYAENLENKRTITPSLAGLAEVEGKAYSHLLEKYLANENVKIAKSAFLTLTKLNKERAHEIAIINLESELKPLRRAAAKFLEKLATREGVERARGIFRTGRPELRIEMLSMFSHIGGWTAISDILRGTIDENEEIRELAVKYLGFWKMKAARFFSRPNFQDMEDIKKVVELVYDEHEKKRFFETNPIESLEFYLK
jgi:HEAT repeat protein